MLCQSCVHGQSCDTHTILYPFSIIGSDVAEAVAGRVCIGSDVCCGSDVCVQSVSG